MYRAIFVEDEVWKKIRREIKRMRNYIAPHRPPTLAVFPPWGSSEGAGRTALIQGVKVYKCTGLFM